jgi:hypothetical protein
MKLDSPGDVVVRALEVAKLRQGVAQRFLQKSRQVGPRRFGIVGQAPERRRAGEGRAAAEIGKEGDGVRGEWVAGGHLRFPGGGRPGRHVAPAAPGPCEIAHEDRRLGTSAFDEPRDDLAE